ncbi:hypothetical protein BOTCAL_0046g00040 [Botryotinia calthae]|uniref:RBR-type E3 ubiquitin transferase n=1 Tax=Botryotinia calthae TaxID=38488 RepID=A0A4Y8DBR3_9HELO|nr:hypothetical protein BOTCAL_0046g00040 [Botryotinia calthae]
MLDSFLQSTLRQAVNLTNNTQTDSNENPGQLQCFLCQESQDLQKTFTFPCSCVFCSTCLQERFTRAIETESMFPVRCCLLVDDLTSAYHLLSPEIIRDYEAKKIEYEATDRMYCANKVCSAFIVPECIKGHQAFCNKSTCGTVTCTKCKSEWHDGECPHDQDQELVLAEAQRQGWKRCANCGTLIEYVTGCPIMECLCGFEFCYCCALALEDCLCHDGD